MKRLQIVDHNINIGHCKVYSTDCVTNILCFIKFLKFEFRILNSEFCIPNSAFGKKNVVYRNFVFGDATSGSVHGVGPFDLKLEQFKQ